MRPDHVSKFVEIFFRTNNVYRDREIRITSGGEVLASFRREHMAPGEMEKIVFPKALFSKIQNHTITVSVVEAEKKVQP